MTAHPKKVGMTLETSNRISGARCSLVLYLLIMILNMQCVRTRDVRRLKRLTEEDVCYETSNTITPFRSFPDTNTSFQERTRKLKCESLSKCNGEPLVYHCVKFEDNFVEVCAPSRLIIDSSCRRTEKIQTSSPKSNNAAYTELNIIGREKYNGTGCNSTPEGCTEQKSGIVIVMKNDSSGEEGHPFHVINIALIASILTCISGLAICSCFLYRKRRKDFCTRMKKQKVKEKEEMGYNLPTNEKNINDPIQPLICIEKSKFANAG